MKRVSELDGLRGVAVLLVCANHFAVPGFDGGGTVGVQLFFVLSGYLITSILLGCKLSMRQFYLRRARRLLPALLLVCATFSLMLLWLTPTGQWADGVRSVAQVLTFTSNLHPLSQTPWLGHTWSLAVEDQFYLVWPLFAVLAARGRLAVPFAALVVIAEVIGRQIAAQRLPVQIWNWDALMAGCMVARFRVSLNKQWGLLGWLILIPMAISRKTWIIDPNTMSTVGGTLVLLSSGRTIPLRLAILRHVGQISYGLYLWHYMLIWFFWFHWWVAGLSLAAAEASYWLWERRFLPQHHEDTGNRPHGRSFARTLSEYNWTTGGQAPM